MRAVFWLWNDCVLPVGGQWCDLPQRGGGRGGGLQIPRRLCRGAAARGLGRLGALQGAAGISWKRQASLLFLLIAAKGRVKKSPVKKRAKTRSDTIRRKAPGSAAAARCCIKAITLGLRPKQRDAVHETRRRREAGEDQERGRRTTQSRREGFVCAAVEV